MTLDNLNTMQKEAVLHIQGPLLIIAGAGSGKTTVLTHKVAYILQKGVPPFNILAITFTNKAAKDMQTRIVEFSPAAKNVWIGTFHSVCVRILRTYANKIGYSNNFNIYDMYDVKLVVEDLKKSLNIDKKWSPSTIVKYISAWKEKLMGPSKAMGDAQSEEEKTLAMIYREYQNILKSNNSMDFDDLIYLTVKLFKESEEVLKIYQNRFKYIMVDEYQDTNMAQYKLIRLLADYYKNICAVGDDDQSIYAFRGADIKNILNFEKDFEGARVIKLEQNYRSTKLILDTANEAIAHNINRKGKNLWSEKEKGSKIEIHESYNSNDEADYIVNKCKELRQDGFNFKDMAVLYRNNYLSGSIEEAMVKANIPYRVYSGVRFYDRKEIKDILAFLKVIYNPHDEVAIMRIIKNFKNGIGNVTVSRVIEYARQHNISLFESMQSNDTEKIGAKIKGVSAFRNQILDLMSYSKTASIQDLISKVIKQNDYEDFQEEHILEIMNVFKDRAAEFDCKFESMAQDEKTADRLSMFLEEVALIENIGNYNASEDAVILMTIHSAKGLEFPIVYVIGLEEGIFPSSFNIETEQGIEEERRLMYVALTRAKEKVFLTYSIGRDRKNNSKININKDDNQLSRFLEELPEDNVTLTYGNAKSRLRTIMSKPKTNKKELSYGKPYIMMSSYMPNEPKHDNDSDFSVGDYVEHGKYGLGRIMNIKGSGAESELSIDFKDVGVKKFLAKFSRLSKHDI